MMIAEAVELIRPGVKPNEHPQMWADLGCGTGTFTRALSELLAAQSEIYAVDREQVLISPPTLHHVQILFMHCDFVVAPLDLSELDGILIANALHFVEKKLPLIQKLRNILSPTGRLIIVEYDTQKSNPWVPYPIDFSTLVTTFNAAGFQSIDKIAERDSIFGADKMYAACIQQ